MTYGIAAGTNIKVAKIPSFGVQNCCTDLYMYASMQLCIMPAYSIESSISLVSFLNNEPFYYLFNYPFQGNCIKDIQTSSLFVNGRPSMVTLDYFIDVTAAQKMEEEGEEELPSGRKLKVREDGVYK